jgi:hypothetical protein
MWTLWPLTPFGYLGGGDPCVKPEGHCGVAEVVGDTGEWGPDLGRGESALAGVTPGLRVGVVRDRLAGRGHITPCTVPNLASGVVSCIFVAAVRLPGGIR